MRRFRLLACLSAYAASAFPAHAHTGEAALGGLVEGFLHPLAGADHIVAMIAVGLWAAYLGASAMWALPAVFPIVMAIGGVAAIAGLPLPAIELGIASSALALGLMIAFAVRATPEAAAALVAAFAVFHGYAHGQELPEGATALSYALGFVAATIMLHLTGVALGVLTRSAWSGVALRAAGGAIAIAGFGFISNAI